MVLGLLDNKFKLVIILCLLGQLSKRELDKKWCLLIRGEENDFLTDWLAFGVSLGKIS